MSTLTKTQQQELANQLDQLYTTTYLRCDEYFIQASMQRVAKNKLAIGVYVNGYIKGKWWNGEDEEPKRFWRAVVTKKFKPSFIKEMEKIIGKRECKKRGYHETVTHYTPDWLRPMPFIRQLLKQNKHVEVISYETYKKAMETIGPAPEESVH